MEVESNVTTYGNLSNLHAVIGKMITDGAVHSPEKVVEVFQQIIAETPKKDYLRQLFTDVEIGTTDGTETFESSGLFIGGICNLDVLPTEGEKKSTKTTKGIVWEVILDVNFAQLFGGSSKGKHWTEAQIVRFCLNHYDKLNTKKCGNLFEMKNRIADIFFDDKNQLSVFIYPRSCTYMCKEEHHSRLITLV